MTSTEQPTITASGLVVCDDGRNRPPWAANDPLLRTYYDTEWGLPVHDERRMFEHLVLETFQAGLSWRTVLAKREAFRLAFVGFEPAAVAAFGGDDIERMMLDPGVIRNRRKIEAAINNAKATVALAAKQPRLSLVDIVWSHAPSPETWRRPVTITDVPTRSAESEALAVDLRERGFRFVGPVSAFALMEATGVIDTRPADAYRPRTPSASGSQSHVTPSARPTIQPLAESSPAASVTTSSTAAP